MRAKETDRRIWPGTATVIIQFCISHDNKSPDTRRFDLDGGATNCILQYNLSYNNDGPVLPVPIPRCPVFRDNIIRYNISQNDGVKNNRRSGIDIYSASSNASACQVYNNTVYSRHGAAVDSAVYPCRMSCFAIISSSAARRGFGDAGADGSRQPLLVRDGRVCRSTPSSLRAWPRRRARSALAVKSSQDRRSRLTGAGTATATDPRPCRSEGVPAHAGFAVLAAGMIITDNGGRDFWAAVCPKRRGRHRSVRRAIGSTRHGCSA